MLMGFNGGLMVSKMQDNDEFHDQSPHTTGIGPRKTKVHVLQCEELNSLDSGDVWCGYFKLIQEDQLS